MGHELSFALGWALLGAVSLLFLFSVWYLLTATDDYRKVKDTPSARESVVLVSVGAVMEGWLKLIAASLWLVVGIWVVNVPATGRWQGRAFLTLLTLIYLVKIGVRRWTHYGVTLALNAEQTQAQIAEALAAKVKDAERLRQEQHTELLQAISENTQVTKETGAAADKAFSEANHANEKIINLNERLIETEKRTRE
jgi:hypothetical protein